MDSTRARRRRRLARRRTDGRRASHRLSHRSSARHVSLSRARRRVPMDEKSIVGYALVNLWRDDDVCARDARRRALAREGIFLDRDVASSRARDARRDADDDARGPIARER